MKYRIKEVFPDFEPSYYVVQYKPWPYLWWRTYGKWHVCYDNLKFKSFKFKEYRKALKMLYNKWRKEFIIRPVAA